MTRYYWESTVRYLLLYAIIFQALPIPAFIFMPGCFMPIGTPAKCEVLCYNLLSILFRIFKMQIKLYCKLLSKLSCLSDMDELFLHMTLRGQDLEV